MTRYRNIGRDFNSMIPEYRSWITNNAPDLTGIQYTGLKSGDTPLLNISSYVAPDDGYFDYSLPEPTQFLPALKVLPSELSDSQIAVLDGYVYSFGSKLSDKIYRATLNNPADWADTDAVLPTKLCNSSLAIVNSVIYLFGGQDGYGSTNTIFSAPVSDPLNWTNTGRTLPIPLHSSSLGMSDGYLYMFGGNDGYGATNVILTASTSDPLTWTIGPGTIPDPIYGSTIVRNDGYWHLLGGQLSPGNDTNAMYRAPVSAPFSWELDGYMTYHTSYGQFFPMGNDGYYMGPSPGDAGTGFTTILQTPLNDLTLWVDTQQVVPAVLSHSQLAIVADRLWFFGGSGLSAIFVCNQQLKYDYRNATVVAYDNNTRANFQTTDNANEPFLALGIAYWRTNYFF